MKILKRPLIAAHGLTPGAYRVKWRLPADDPLVTTAYAELRSMLAKQSAMGKRG
jgi:predicted transcriptional regulator